MTLDELKIVRKGLSSDTYFQEEAREIIEREIRLKETNPVTGCRCQRDEKGYVIFENPACEIHGVAAQLNRSQME